MTFQPFGDSAILIAFEQKIDVQINFKVTELTHYIEGSNWDEVIFLTPAYCSLTVGYNPLLSSYDVLADKINELIKNGSLDNNITLQETIPRRTLNIPVCYDAEFALDIGEVGKQNKLTDGDIVNLHSTPVYQVFMLGFLPGFPYLGSLADQLICNRKDSPRLRVPSGSVGIAGKQTGIYPLEAPGGWQIIGRTPIDIFTPKSDKPFLFRAGDSVQFEAIDLDAFHGIEKESKLGKYDLTKLYV